MSELDQVQRSPSPPPASANGDQVLLTGIAEYDSFHPAFSSNLPQTCWAVTNLKAPFYEPESVARAAVDIVAVIDKSGSMRGEKIQLVKKTLLFVIDQLKECDRISLVTYDTQVELVFGLMKMDKPNKERAKSFVESIRDGSSTNLCGGLLKGMEQIALTCGGEKAQVQSVLLLTDGLANHWITSKEGIIAEMKKMQTEGLGAVSTPSSSGYHHQSPFLPFVNQAPQAKKGKKRVPPAFRNVQQQQAPPPLEQQQQQLAPVMQQQAPVMLQQQQAPVMQQQQAPVMQQQAPVMQQQQQAPVMLQQQQAPVMQQQAPVMQQQAPVMQQQALQAPLNLVPPPPLLPEAEAADSPKKLDEVTSGYKFDGTVYTFGFGSDHDATLLEAISTQGGGVYYYIDTNEKIPESFADCLGGLLSVMGQNLALTLEAEGEFSFQQVHANRAIKWKTPNKSCEILLGDLQSEEERDIVLEVSVPPVPLGTQLPVLGQPMFTARLSYFNIITAQMDRVECQLTITRDYSEEQKASDTKVADSQRRPNIAVDVQRNRILATSVLKQAETLADQGRMSEAQKALKDVMSRLEKSISGDQEFCKVLLADLKRCLESMTTRQRYQAHGKLATVNMIQTHSVQRSNYSGDDVSSVYQNKTKKMFVARSKK